MRQHLPADRIEMHRPRSRGLQTGDALRALLRVAAGRGGLTHWLTLLCLGLVFLSGTVQAEHVHAAYPGSADTHAACSLCVTAHVGVETVAAPLPATALTVVGQPEPRLPEAAFAAAKNFDLYTRPPPSALILA